MSGSDASGGPPCTGLVVVELADDPAGELTGFLLAQMGATVRKLEGPGGAASRSAGPFAGDLADPEASLPYWFYNGNKDSVVADLATPDGRAVFEAELAGADVLLSTLAPRHLRRLALALDELVAARPELIVVSVTPFGLTGAWADYLSSDLVGLAASGLLNMSGYDDHTIPPIRPGGDQGYHVAGTFAHMATLLALVERGRSGRGGLVDVSMHDALAVTCELSNPFWFYPGFVVRRQTCRHAQPVPTQPAHFLCGDGRYVYFALILAEQKPWQALVDWMATLDMALDLSDAAFLDVGHRQANFAYIQNLVECFFLVQDSLSVYHDGQARGLPIGILNAPEDLFDDEHLQARQFFVPVDQPGVGTVRYPGPPYRFSAFPPVARRAAPTLGAAAPTGPAD